MRFSISKLLIRKIVKSSQQFQAAFHVIELKPKTIFKMIKAGLRMYYGGRIASKPLYLHIEPTGACNLKCTMCARTTSITREMSHMKIVNFLKILEDIDPVFVAFIGFGEPLLNPDIFKMIKYSKKKGVISQLSTNCTLLNKETSTEILLSGLDHLRLSIDSPSEKNFENIRMGAKYLKVIDSVKELVKIHRFMKSKMKITIHFTVTKENVHEISKMIDLCFLDLKILVTFATSYSYDINEHMDRSVEYHRDKRFILDGIKKAQLYKNSEIEINLKTILDDLIVSEKKKKFCYMPYYVIAVSWDGKISPCCVYYNYQSNFDKFGTKKISDIWNGRKYQDFRIGLNKEREKIEICSGCDVNDKSLHNLMAEIYKFVPFKFLTKNKYEKNI